MAFKESVRLEQIYFKNLQTITNTLKSLRSAETKEGTLDLIDSCISANNAILLLYKNIGEAWNDSVSMILKNQAELEALKTEVTNYHGEINEKIDEVNNYLMNLVRELQEAVGILQMRIEFRERIVSWNSSQEESYPISMNNGLINNTSYFAFDSGSKFIHGQAVNYIDQQLPDTVNCIRVNLLPDNSAPTTSSDYFIKADVTVTVFVEWFDPGENNTSALNTGFQKSFTAIFKHDSTGSVDTANSIISGENGVMITLPCSLGKAKQLIEEGYHETQVPLTIAVDFTLEFIDANSSAWSQDGEDGIIINAEALVLPDINEFD